MLLGISPFAKLFNHKEDEVFRPTFIEDTRNNVAFILPTQGTTGKPKLICLSHDNIYLQCSVFEEILEFPNRIISFFPLSWVLQTILTCVCLESSTTLIIPGSFTAKFACKIIHDFEIGYAILGTDYAMKLAESVAVKVCISNEVTNLFWLVDVLRRRFVNLGGCTMCPMRSNSLSLHYKYITNECF